MEEKLNQYGLRNHTGGNETNHNHTDTTPPVNPTQTPEPHNVGGIIAGSTVGGIFLVMLVALTVFVLYKRHKYILRQGRALGHRLLPDYVDPAHEEIDGVTLFSTNRDSNTVDETTAFAHRQLEEGNGGSKKSGYQPIK